MRNYILACAAVMLFFISGCSSQTANPEKKDFSADCPIKTPGYAVSPKGECAEFSNFCSIPLDYNVVSDCSKAGKQQEAGAGGTARQSAAGGADLCAGIECADSCDGNTFRSGGKCLGGKCYYLSSKLNALQCGGMPIEAKYDFNASMEKCVYNDATGKYTLAYKIRNTKDNIVPEQSKIWLFVPALNYATGKTVQHEYAKNQVMWEEQGITLVGTRIRGQYWDFKAKTGDYNFMLVLCEPEFAAQEDCSPETGVVVATGSTEEFCPQLETIKQSELDKYMQKYLKKDT